MKTHAIQLVWCFDRIQSTRVCWESQAINSLHVPAGAMKNSRQTSLQCPNTPYTVTFKLARKTHSFFSCFSQLEESTYKILKLQEMSKGSNSPQEELQSFKGAPAWFTIGLSKQQHRDHVLSNEWWSLLKQLVIKNFLFHFLNKVKASWSKSRSSENHLDLMPSTQQTTSHMNFSA